MMHMGIFDTIKSVITDIGETVSKTIDKVEDTAKDIINKTTDLAKEAIYSPTTKEVIEKAVEVTSKILMPGLSAVTDTYNTINRIVADQRIRDKSIRESATKNDTATLINSTNKLADTTETITRVQDTINRTYEVVKKKAKEEQETYEEEVRKSKSELSEIVSKLKDALKTIPWVGYYGTFTLITKLAEACVTRDRSKAESTIKEFLRIKVKELKGLPLLLAIVAATQGTAGFALFTRLIGVVISWLGTASFAKWLIEESMQRMMIQIDEARKRGMVDEVKRGIELNREMEKWARNTLELFSLGPLAVLKALDFFFEANEYALEQTEKALALDILAQAEIYPGNIAKVLEIAQEKAEKGEDLKKEDIEEYLPRVVLTPPAFRTTINNYKQDLLAMKMDILTLINEGQYEKALSKFKDFKKKLDEFRSWIEARKSILEPIGEYKAQMDYITSMESWYNDQLALCKERAAPHGILVITCSLWPDRLYLDESPIEPKPYVEIEVIPGKHTIRAEKEGYHAEAVTVEVKEDERKIVRIKFEKRPQGYGYLTIITAPDCDVYIGSNPTPLHTPVYRYELPPGKYDIRLVREGYREEEVTVLISEGIEQRVEKTLERETMELPTKGSLVVITKPAGAFVTVDGLTHPYKTPTVLLLDPGTHEVKIEKEGYKTIEDTVEIVAGESTRKEYELEPTEELISYRVYIDSEPRGAMIFLDGVYTGRKTPATLSLGKGTWTIRLELSGYWPAEKTITLR